MFDAGRDQVARSGRVVEIIFERVFDRLRHDDRPGEMHRRLDLMLGEKPGEQLGIRNIAAHQRRLRLHRPLEARREIVENDHLFPGLQKIDNRVAANIAGTACYEDSHRCPSISPGAPMRALRSTSYL